MRRMCWEAIVAGVAVSWLLMWSGGVRDWWWYLAPFPACVLASWLEAKIGGGA